MIPLDLIALAAFLCLLSAGIWFFTQKSYPMTLLTAGLLLWLLATDMTLSVTT